MRFRGLYHNLKTAIRVFARSKVYTTINLSGMVLGLTVAFILLIFAINELSYNDYLKNSDRIYRLISMDKKGNKDALSQFVLKQTLKNEFSGIERTGRIISLSSTIGAVSIKLSNAFLEIPDFLCADPECIDILQMKIIRGQSLSVLSQPSRIIISQKSATKYYRSESPIGKSLEVISNGHVYSLIISGVFEDLPWNSTFQADFFAGMGFYKVLLQQFPPDPELEIASTLIQLKDHTNIRDIDKELPKFLQKQKLEQGSINFQNIRDLYLNSEMVENDLIKKGSKENIFIYLSLAVFILLLATINYSMLGTARSALRFKEIGVRKVLGASKGNLRSQLLVESMLLTILAFLLAFLLLGLVAPVIENLFGYRIIIYSGNMMIYLGISAGITVSIGFLSGFYVSLYLSGLDTLTALKSNYYFYKKISFSKIFIVFQLFITLALFISLLIVYQQIRLCLQRQDGSSKENLMMIYLNPDEMHDYGEIMNEIRKSPGVISASGASILIPDNAITLRNIILPGPEKKKVPFEIISVDDDFFNTLNIDFIGGGDFIKTKSSANVPAVIINEEAILQLGVPDAINKTIHPYTITGITKNFNIHSLHNKINPTLFIYNPDACRTMIIRYIAGREGPLQDLIRKHWSKSEPGQPLEYKFFDKQLNSLYIKEQNFGHVIVSFTFLAFIITGMGLFGLAMLIAEKRMKEMSVRKVFGASRGNVIYLIQKEFIVYIIIAAVAAIPLAWYVLTLWLNEFYYHITIQWYIFLLSVVVVGCFVSLILFIKTLRILQENPANALKYE